MHLSTAIHVWELEGAAPLIYSGLQGAEKEAGRSSACSIYQQQIWQKKYSSSPVLVESLAFEESVLIKNISGRWYLFSAENCSWSSDHNPSYFNFITLLKSFIYSLWLSYVLLFRPLGVLWPCDCCDAPFPCTNKVKEEGLLVYLFMTGNPIYNEEFHFATPGLQFPGGNTAMFRNQNIFLFHCHFRLFCLKYLLNCPFSKQL